MVNLEKIDRIEKDTLVIGQVQIPVSRSYREVMQELIKLKKD
jgi:DNA-binding LytR/AlgR family response regulator